MRNPVTASPEAVALSIAAAEAASDKLAEDIVAIDVSEKLVITDVFVLCSAANERQVKSVVDAVEERLHAMGSKPLRREGEAEGRWVLLDFGDIVVHVQLSEERIHYAIERLWKDCPVIELPDAVNQGRRRVEARDGE
ncbi:Iojap-related protein [sediment metagenome]|uniref:Iojap-related protein n=1 Tax=sediment metagenome TaxID=749907 RepID=D9PIG0_9ZZZZ